MVAGISPLHIHTTYPKVYIEKKLPKVMIDQYECFKEAGLKNNADFSRECSQDAFKKSMEGIEKICYEGNRMVNIENGDFDVIPELAFENMLKEKQFNIDIIPKSRPKIEVVGELKINWEMGKLEFYKEKISIYKKKPINKSHLDEEV